MMSTYQKDYCIACIELQQNCSHSSQNFHSYNSHKIKPYLEEQSTFQGLLDTQLTIESSLYDQNYKLHEINQNYESDENESAEEDKIIEQRQHVQLINGGEKDLTDPQRAEDVVDNDKNVNAPSLQLKKEQRRKAGAKMKLSTSRKTFYPKLKSYLFKIQKNHKNIPRNINNGNIGSIIQEYNTTVYQYLANLSNYIPLKKGPSTKAARQEVKKRIAFKKKAKDLIDQYWKN